MVRFEGEPSNELFDTLADWNEHLKAENVELPKPVNRRNAPTRGGPSI